MNKITKRQEGFTIIEVMIVLVIAAVILLIVFLAVPALQRNSRNTQRKNEVAAVLAGANEYEANNNGAAPTTWTAATTTLSGPAGTSPVTVKLGFYAGADVALANGTHAPANIDTEAGRMFLQTGAKCTAAGGTTNVGASSRQLAAIYVLEGNPNVSKCQEG